ncbi:MAG: hypothetical protein ABI866_03580 [Dokdonella sp.]
MRLVYLSAIAAIVLFVGATANAVLARTATSPQQHADQLVAADRDFAAAAAKADHVGGISAMFSADVIMPVHGKGFARGKAAVIEALKARPETSSTRVEWTPIGVGVSADGKQGFTYGFLTEYAKDDKQNLLKYLAYWRHDNAGWRVIAYNRGRRAPGAIDTAPRTALLPGPITATTTSNSSVRATSLTNSERAFSDAAQEIGLTAAFAEFGSVDSMNLGGGGNAGFVFGAEAISRLVGAGEPDHGSSVSWAADERVMVADSGDLGLSVGNIRFNQRAEDGSERPPIPFFTVWRRASAEQPWRYVAE